MKKHRALWLLSDDRIRKFEVSTLIDRGYEVYCPKVFPKEDENLLVKAEYSYDETLTIPQEVIHKLNQVDFFRPVSAEVMKLINQYFDIVFFGFYIEQMKLLVEGFRGILVMRAFGLPDGDTYAKIIEQELGISFLNKVEKLGDRFFFGQAYQGMVEIESRYLKNRAVYLPVGLADTIIKDKWKGDDKRVLIDCPRINTSSYFDEVYKKLEKEFKNFDYVIDGIQPIGVIDNTKVKSTVSREQYEYDMEHIAVMFDYSQEKRILKYESIEAVKCGMPLVFMQGGLLEKIAGKKLPGCCKNISDARKLISHILRGNRKLIARIKESQGVLLRPFQYEFCRKEWEKTLKKIEFAAQRNRKEKENKRVRIGVLLTEGYTGGVLDYTLRFMHCVIRAVEESKRNIELVFGYYAHPNFAQKDYFYKFRKQNIPVRSFIWKHVDAEYLNSVMKFKGWDKTFPVGEYCLLDDGGNYFEDCDYLILTVDRVPLNFFTFCPYVVVVHDYIQRYLPELYGAVYEKYVIDLQRNAEAVFVMTEPTLEDGIQYAGLCRDKLRLTPLMFDLVQVEEVEEQMKQKNEKPYFLWSTNVGRHKNHLLALNALAEYYARGGKLLCYITGLDTKKFDYREKYEAVGDYISQIREVIKSNPLLKKNLVFCGNMDKEKYHSILKNAKFFMHPGFTDNGNMTAIDAASLGVPTLTSDYPAMRYYENRMKLNMYFFNPFEEKELAEALFYMENNYEKQVMALPPIEEIEKYTINYTYRELYNIVENVLKLY